jgi:hypothetical protein
MLPRKKYKGKLAVVECLRVTVKPSHRIPYKDL